MNLVLQKLFSRFYTPEFSANHNVPSRVSGTVDLRIKLEELFQRHHIRSIFDAGCNNCNWMKLLSQFVDYHGGDISLATVAQVWQRYPELDVILHDITTDPIPAVDLLFVRDVTIHLDHADKTRLLQNWSRSSIPWILVTHYRDMLENQQQQYRPGELLVDLVHWQIAPWLFPAPVDVVDEYGAGGKCMALWHRDQLKGIL